MDYQEIFASLKQAYVKLGEYADELPENESALKAEVIAKQKLILEALNSSKLDIKENDLYWVELEKNFIKSDIYVNEKELSNIINLLGAIDTFAQSKTQNIVNRTGNYLYASLFGTSSLPSVAVQLEKEFNSLKEIAKELQVHNKEYTKLKTKDVKQTVEPMLQKLPATDASSLVTQAAVPHVEECLRQNFSVLFEYACCLQELINKLPKNNQASRLIKVALNQILQELNIDGNELQKLNKDEKLYYLDKQEKFVAAKITKDCLDVSVVFQHHDHMRKNMNAVFAKLDEEKIGEYVLVRGLKNCYEACEKNQDVTIRVLEDVQFVRDQAKKITTKFHHPLFKHSIITMKAALSLLGISDFIAKNIQMLSCKELSDLMRTRMALEANDLTMQTNNVNVIPVRAFNVQVDLGESDPILGGMRKFQTANLEKYSIIYAQQLQMACILLEYLPSATDPKLKINVERLQVIYNGIIGSESDSTIKYNNNLHRELHAVLNAISSDFYKEVDQRAMQLLVAVGNVQKKNRLSDFCK